MSTRLVEHPPCGTWSPTLWNMEHGAPTLWNMVVFTLPAYAHMASPTVTDNT